MNAFVKVAVAAAAVACMSGPAVAAGQQEEATAFYSDESETTIVGWTIVYCDGSFVHTGTRTVYSETTYYTC